MKTKSFLAYSIFAACAVTAIVVIGRTHKEEMSIGAATESTVYQYNHMNFDGRIDKEAAKGDQFKGVDGHHFVITECAGSTDYHVTLFNYDTEWTLEVDKEYKLSFEYKIDSATASSFKLVSSCRWVEGKPDAVDIYHVFNIERDDYGKYLTSERTFTANVEHPEIDIHLGLNTGEFDVFIRRIEVTKVDEGTVVSSTYLESPDDFAKRWNGANNEDALCAASETDVRNLLKLYSELVPWIRNKVNDKIAANNSESTLGAQIAYFAERVHVSFNS